MCCVVLFVSCNCFMPHQVAWKSRLEWFRLVADVRAVDLSVARQRRRRRGGKLQQSLPIDQRGVLAAGAVPNTLPSARLLFQLINCLEDGKPEDCVVCYSKPAPFRKTILK
ncbi:uncharacterized protein LOC129776208 isoform X2 [Toxorhynchites rutilus septentrionalis]|uniref:uncharacterized protein LOC129776208 isoform X2 n=1 Tax=Toxorhynchites rutilus septentrionalis TaxID=329112 RepID=UPI00247865B3|nr:uncharacterized protein LOC129776208 isoform X2 [Toxorhynchites rutilus septentrionalis]